MKISIVYYSRTGCTERVVNELKLSLANEGFMVDVYRVVPLREYFKPLHVNLRLMYDTFVRRGTSSRLEPSDLNPGNYDALIVASPIWIDTLSSPVQEILKRYIAIKPIIITTSVRSVGVTRLERVVEKLNGVKPLLCINVRDVIIRDYNELRKVIQEIIKRLKAILSASACDRSRVIGDPCNLLTNFV
ncbi:MAG: hypothetical protein QW701_01490 [Candidatus Nezhaarchaeales archaeon]